MFNPISRMGPNGVRMIGWIRILFGAANLIDRFLLGLDLDFFFSPNGGVLSIDKTPVGFFGALSLMRFVGESDLLLWTFYIMGIIHAVLLLLGIAPRLNVILLYINSCSFHNASWFLCDGTDTGVNFLVRLFSLYFIFLPLNHVTIFDKFGKNMEPNCSWPMWPVWLFQWQSVLVMLGAMIGKFDGSNWLDGTAMYYVSNCTDEGVGIFNPDIIFNRMLPSKIMSWAAFAVEVISPFTVWFEKTRTVTLIVLFKVFVGMDITMNMGTFELYNIIGWAFFLIRCEKNSESFVSKKEKTNCSAGKSNKYTSWLRQILGFLIFSMFTMMATIMAFPLDIIIEISPPRLKQIVERIEPYRNTMGELIPWQVVEGFDIEQDVWTLFSGGYDGTTAKIAIDVTLIDGSFLSYRTINWKNLAKWKRKRYYNYLNYLKHIADGEEVEQQDFLIMLTERVLTPRGISVEEVSFYAYYEYPPPPADNLGWFDKIKTDDWHLEKNEYLFQVRRNSYDEENKEPRQYSVDCKRCSQMLDDLFEIFDLEEEPSNMEEVNENEECTETTECTK